MSSKVFLAEGIQFQCQGSGNCCVSHGSYGNVYVTPSDRKALARALGLKPSVFTRKFCQRKLGVWKLKDGDTKDCLFLKNKRCTVYQARPTQCRTWPFWPEVMNAKAWNREVASFCPGVGKGRVWPVEEIQRELNAQIQSEDEYGR